MKAITESLRADEQLHDVSNFVNVQKSNHVVVHIDLAIKRPGDGWSTVRLNSEIVAILCIIVKYSPLDMR